MHSLPLFHLPLLYYYGFHPPGFNVSVIYSRSFKKESPRLDLVTGLLSHHELKTLLQNFGQKPYYRILSLFSNGLFPCKLKIL